MAERHGDKGPMFWSWLSWGAALIGALIIGFLVAALSGEGAPTGLVFGAVAFVVLIAVLSRYLGPAPDDDGGAGRPWRSATTMRRRPRPPRRRRRGLRPGGAGPAPRRRRRRSTRRRPTPRRGRSASGCAMRRGRPGRRRGRRWGTVAAPPEGAAGAAGVLSGPLEGGPDNLMRLKGVGPKFAEMLNANGVYHFHQIAAWGPDEIAWIESNIEGFSGRVVRDDWVGQSKVLAARRRDRALAARRPGRVDLRE